MIRRSKVRESTKDQVKGSARELKGKVKQGVGRAARRPDIEAEGTVDRASGKVQKKVGQIKRVFEK